MAWCLRGSLANQFLQKLRSGEINPEKLIDMTSAERHAYFSEFLGEENATRTNALFESKLLLKGQQEGIVNWAKQSVGMKPDVKRDILSRVERMTEVLEPKDADNFYNDLVNQKLGMSVTLEEAGHITELAKTVADKKAIVEPIASREGYSVRNETPQERSQRLDYGASRYEFSKYVGNLKVKSKKVTFEEFKSKPATVAGKVAYGIAGLAKSLKSTLDDSYQFRQGIKALYTHPIIWSRNFAKSFQLIKRELAGGKDVMGGVMADIYSRPNELNGNYGRWKIDVGTTEEAFPSHIVAKVPVIKRVYKAAETAFTATARLTRADLADYYYDIAQKSGGDVLSTPEVAQSFGKLINSLTARGHLGVFESAGKITNVVFFSVKNIKSNIDFLTAHQFQKDVSPFVRKQAAINLLKAVGAVSAIMTVANAVKPGSVEKDPRSSDFGKIKVRGTRFDVTGGMGSFVTLGARLAAKGARTFGADIGAKKSTVTGKFTSPAGTNMIYNFFENKLSPAVSVAKDLLKGSDFQGNKLTVPGEASNLFTPMPVTTYAELKKNPNAANIIASMIVDALGVSANTYFSFSDLTKNEVTRLQSKKLKVSPSLPEGMRYKGLTPDQNTQLWQKTGQLIDSRMNDLLSNLKYKALGDDEKGKLINNMINDTKFEVRLSLLQFLMSKTPENQKIQRLKEFGKSGFMTKELFDKLNE